MSTGTRYAPPAAVASTVVRRAVRVQACLQGGRKGSSEGVVGVLLGPSYSQSCGCCVRRVVHRLALRRPLRRPDYRRPHCSPHPIHMQSERNLAAKIHPPSSGQIPPPKCRSCSRTTSHDHGQAVKLLGSRSRIHSRGVKVRNPGEPSSKAPRLDLWLHFQMRSHGYQGKSRATVHGGRQSLGQQRQG